MRRPVSPAKRKAWRDNRLAEGTRLTLEHRGWETLPVDHVARHGLEGMLDDDTLPRPQSSYGIQKFVGEQLGVARRCVFVDWLNPVAS